LGNTKDRRIGVVWGIVKDVETPSPGGCAVSAEFTVVWGKRFGRRVAIDRALGPPSSLILRLVGEVRSAAAASDGLGAIGNERVSMLELWAEITRSIC
jgi:hypothetical protein